MYQDRPDIEYPSNHCADCPPTPFGMLGARCIKQAGRARPPSALGEQSHNTLSQVVVVQQVCQRAESAQPLVPPAQSGVHVLSHVVQDVARALFFYAVANERDSSFLYLSTLKWVIYIF